MIFFFIPIAIALLYIYVKYKHSYWTRRGLYQIPPEFLIGNFREEVTLKASMGEAGLKKYLNVKAAKQRHAGYYMLLEPMYMPIDPVIIKHILQADFPHFTAHGFFNHPNDLLTNHIFNMEGEEWRKLRVKITPTFSPNQIKMMFGILLDKKIHLEQAVERAVGTGEPVNIKDIVARFITDTVGSCGFGIECNSLENPEVPLRKYGKKVFEADPFAYIASILIPWGILGKLNFKFYGKENTKYFSDMIKTTIEYRQKNQIKRKDFLQLLIDLNDNDQGNNGEPKKNENRNGLTINQVISHSFLFFITGFDTSSSITTFTLFELSRNSEIQEKAREEIKGVLAKYGGEITYDGLMEMKYLDNIIHETLRLYPPVAMLPRMCTKTYKVPGTDIVIEKGTRVEIPALGLQTDPEYYPNPDVYNPDNFNDENRAKHVEYTYLPFGEGPRYCLGNRFGKVQAKFVMSTLLSKYKFALNEKTKYPLKMIPANLATVAEGYIWLNVTKV